jgi:hypothetical protein
VSPATSDRLASSSDPRPLRLRRPCTYLAPGPRATQDGVVPRYLIERRIHADLSDDERDGLALRSATLLATEFPDLHWEHSHAYVDADGTRGTVCIYTAAGVDAIHAHASRIGGHEIVRVVEISGDISPADFPL